MLIEMAKSRFEQWENYMERGLYASARRVRWELQQIMEELETTRQISEIMQAKRNREGRR